MNTVELRARALFLNCKLRQWCCPGTYIRSSLAGQHRRQFQPDARRSSSNRFRPYYVTSPIFYVNAEPHAGHLYTLLLTDVLKRWQVLKGDTHAALLTGTDEHGMKVQKAAEKLSMPPKELCDKNAQKFLQLAEKANVSLDRFIRTTDADHKTAVEHFWKELKQRGYIYESKHEGWYAVSDETFYPESQVHLILDPATGRKLHASKETGKEVEWTSEVNYHFRLSTFADRLLEHYEQHPEFIVPEERMNFIKKEVQAGLQDLSVSRPSSRLQWGIRVPGDETQTIYVWLDALINYLTMTGYPSGEGNKHKLWPPNAQVIGKDIVRFHTIYWPAFLMALDIPLPRGFLTHAHWTMGRAKMSKSLGNGVNPFFAIERYGLDTIRYFMIYAGGIVNDADYDNSFIVEHYQKGLQGGLGNLLARILLGTWSIREAIVEVTKGPAHDMLQRPQFVQDIIKKIDETASIADRAIERHLDPRSAIRTIMELVFETNRFISSAEPWNLVKLEDRDSRMQLHQIIYTASESLRVACILLQPFMPDKMQQALDQLEVAPDNRGFQYAAYGRDTTYALTVSAKAQGSRLKGKRIKHAKDNVLFPPLIAEF